MKNMKTFLLILENSIDFVPISVISKKLSVSERTIYNYENELIVLAKKLNVVIERDRIKGLRLIGDTKSIDKLHSLVFKSCPYSPEERRTQIYEMIVMHDKKVSVRKLENLYYVSKNSIVKDLQDIEKELEPYNLTLVRDKSGTYMKGLEQHIRRVKRNYIYKLFQKNYETGDLHDINDVRKLLRNFIDEKELMIVPLMIEFLNKHLENQPTNDEYYNQLFIEMAIFLQRVRQKHYLINTKPRPVATELHQMKTYPATVELSMWLNSEYGMKISEKEIGWLNARISGNYHEEMMLDSVKENELIQTILHDMIQMVSSIIGENLMHDESLVNGLTMHLIPMIIRITNKVKIVNPFLLQIKEQYPALFGILSFSTERMERKLDMYISDDEISFLLIHFQSAIERINVSKKIAIVLKERRANSTLIESRIKRFIPRFDVVEVFNINEFDVKYLNDFDCIITTDDFDYPGKQVVHISQFVTEKDVDKIHAIFQNHTLRSQQSLKSFIDLGIIDDMIFMSGSWDNKADLLKDIHVKLYEGKYVDEKFLESLYNREKVSSTEMMNKVAIPHGTPEFVIKDNIVIVRLDKPLIWTNQKVDIVFCLAVNFDNKDRTESLVRNLYYIIHDKRLLDFIYQCNTKKDITDLFHAY